MFPVTSNFRILHSETTSMLEPLQTQLTEVDGEIEQREEEIASLKAKISEQDEKIRKNIFTICAG